MKKFIIPFLLLHVSVFAKPTVSVSVLPQEYFVKKIAKDTLEINTLVLKGNSPHTYEPKPKQMVDLEKSDIYFAIGVPFENVWLKKFRSMYPKLSVINTDDGIEKLKMKEHHHEHEEHAHHEHHGEHKEHAHHEEHEEHEHHHGEEIYDPHIWLDPKLVQVQAKTIAKALIEKYPENKNLYEKNLKSFLVELDQLNDDLAKLLKDKKGKTFLVYHPSWGYFAKRYGLNQEAIEIEGKEPKSKDLQNIINEAKEDKIHVIFVQPQFSQKSAKVIAKQINGQVVSIDQLAQDWEHELRRSAKVLADSLK